jgi:hypoxanthine phosphoribosyltransferase
MDNSSNILLDELEFEIPSWNQIYWFLLNLAKAIQNDGFRADVIVAVSRGGWIPARILSDLLENSRVANVSAEFYKGTTKIRCKPIITQSVSVSVKEKNILLVDDVADTGESLRLVNSHLKEGGASKIKIVTIYKKPWSSINPDYYSKETCLWIVFPWEIKETVKKIVEKFVQQGKTLQEVGEKLISAGIEKQLVERFIKEIL